MEKKCFQWSWKHPFCSALIGSGFIVETEPFGSRWAERNLNKEDLEGKGESDTQDGPHTPIAFQHSDRFRPQSGISRKFTPLTNLNNRTLHFLEEPLNDNLIFWSSENWKKNLFWMQIRIFFLSCGPNKCSPAVAETHLAGVQTSGTERAADRQRNLRDGFQEDRRDLSSGFHPNDESKERSWHRKVGRMEGIKSHYERQAQCMSGSFTDHWMEAAGAAGGRCYSCCERLTQSKYDRSRTWTNGSKLTEPLTDWASA